MSGDQTLGTPTLSSDPEFRAATEQLQRGGPILLIDDDRDRGEFLAVAATVSAETVNLMVTHGRGLIAVAITPAQRDRLELPMMTGSTSPAMVDAGKGVTTGISAADRARTIRVVSNPRSMPEDIVCPGHVVCFVSTPGGLLARTGRPEAAVEATAMVGRPAATLCEVLDESGELADASTVHELARSLELPSLSLQDLIYRRTELELGSW